MNNKLLAAFAFAVGAGIGVGGSYLYFKNKYEKMMNDEFQKKRALNDKVSDWTIEKSEENQNKKDIENYIVNISNYADIASKYSNDEPIEPKQIAKEIVKNVFDKNKNIEYITQEEFVERVNENEPEWSAIGLSFFKDEVLTDENEEIIEDPEKYIGPISELNHHFFSEDTDAVYICNHELKIYYEIVYDIRCYSDLKKPSKIEQPPEES